MYYTDNMFDIISIGAATVDIFVKSDCLRLQKDLLTLPASSKNEISEGLIASGGGSTNSAVSFARLGLKSACLSLLGQDPLAQYVVEDLKKDGVATEMLIQELSENTDYSVILIDEKGGRSILTNRGATHLEICHIDWDKVDETKWFYITSLEGNLGLLGEIMEVAKKRKIGISLNPGNRELNQREELWPRLAEVEFLLLNRGESEKLAGMEYDNPKFWDKLISCGAKTIAVTNGREGAHVASGGKRYFQEAINLHPVDETGAGDAFGSGFVAGLIVTGDPQKALKWGAQNSASVVSYIGAKPGLLERDKIN